VTILIPVLFDNTDPNAYVTHLRIVRGDDYKL